MCTFAYGDMMSPETDLFCPLQKDCLSRISWLLWRRQKVIDLHLNKNKSKQKIFRTYFMSANGDVYGSEHRIIRPQ